MRRKQLVGFAIFATMLGMLAVAAAGQRPLEPTRQQQMQPQGVDAGPPIAELRIAVQDMKTKDDLGFVNPGGTLTLKVGDWVRLRMVAIPEQARRAPRYPSTRFGLLAGKARLSLSKIDEAVGSVEVRAVQTLNPGNQQATTLISYEILEPISIRPALKGGTLTVEVVEPAPPPPPPAPVVPTPAPHSDEPGVTLFEHQDFHGFSQKFSRDVRDLRSSSIRQDRASSVQIDYGCKAILYEHPDFGGKSTVVTEDIEDLRDTRVGSDTVSSLTIDCDWRDPGYGDHHDEREPGITLYEHQDFQGTSEKFVRDVRNLRGTRIQQDRASSVRIDRGCEAILYEHPDFEGRTTVVTESIVDLRETRVGNDSVSSLTIECHGRHRGDLGPHDRDPAWRQGVILYADRDFRGASQQFHRDVADLRDSPFGDNRARSVKIDPECRATLFTGPDYRGESVVVTRDLDDLDRTRVGNDSVSSLIVSCGS